MLPSAVPEIFFGLTDGLPRRRTHGERNSELPFVIEDRVIAVISVNSAEMKNGDAPEFPAAVPANYMIGDSSHDRMNPVAEHIVETL